MEHTHLLPGGPLLDLHLNQEEWFFVMERKWNFKKASNGCNCVLGNPCWLLVA